MGILKNKTRIHNYEYITFKEKRLNFLPLFFEVFMKNKLSRAYKLLYFLKQDKRASAYKIASSVVCYIYINYDESFFFCCLF